MADYRRFVGPAAALLAVTIAVVLIRVVFASNGSSAPPRTTTTTTVAKVARRFWTVHAGDTLGAIARKSGVTVADIKRLNPHLSTLLFIGEKVRLR